MNTKGMIRSSWRNSCGTNHHHQYNALSAHGGCVPLGFYAVEPGRKLRIALNPLCNGSALANTSNVRSGSSILSSLPYPRPPAIEPRRHFGRDDSLQRFIQQVDGKDILDTPLNCLPARVLRFKVMMRRTHARRREHDNHRFFVP